MPNFVGKISGGLLENNLLREGRDLAFETDLLFFDVNTQQVGINTDGTFKPLVINGTFNTDNIISDTQITVDYVTFANNEISTSYPNLIITAAPGGTVSASRLAVGGLDLSGNLIKTTRSNENLDLEPAGSGQVKFNSNVRVVGNIHATGDVTYDGDITFGSADNDSVTLLADVASDIISDGLNRSLGSNLKQFSDLFTENVNGTDFVVGGIATTIDPALRQGNIYYVAINGSDTNVGDHPNGPYRHIKTALLTATTGDTVYIYPGDYEEEFPLTVPAGVSVIGVGVRSVTVTPTLATNDKDCFLLNGETTVQNLTVKDFYYNSTNNTGYAFRFANNFTVTSRSPYVQNVSVITTTTLGSAGAGALVDGSAALYTSNEASMLFHSCTFITPGADALTMTNGVRVEWLNSFTYFANKGFYATQGTGRVTQDGSTLRYGAEVRSIGSANVYGTYGAYADGANVLMYLINHNFGYIGSGTDLSNDLSLVNQENEVVTLNGANVHFTSMDQSGDFRVGDVFIVESATGIIRFNSLAFAANRLYLTDGTNITDIDATKVETGNIRFSGNTILSTVGNIELVAANNQIDLTSNVTSTENLITENIVTNANTVIGNSNLDSLNFKSNFSQNLFTTANKDLGSTSNLWKNVYSSQVKVDDIAIVGNIIKTVVSNSNLELDANGSGVVRINLLDITSNSIISNTANTDININPNGSGVIQLLKNTEITGNLGVTGNITVKGNLQLGDVIVDSINPIGKIGSDLIPSPTRTYNLGSSTKNWNNLFTTEVVTDDIIIKTNFISTTQSNSNLELGANGSGVITIESFDIYNNNITINSANSDLTIQANGAGTVELLNNTDITNNLIVSSNTQVNTNTQFGNSTSDNITFVSEVTSSILPATNEQYELGSASNNINDVFVDTTQINDVNISGNKISTTVSNSNLELTANGSGVVRTDQLDIKNNKISVNLLNTSFDIQANGTGKIDLLSNTDVTGELNVSANTQVNTNTQFGNSTSDNITFVSEVTSSILPSANDQYELGNSLKLFNNIFVDTVQVNDVNITGNVISTTVSNSDLELRATKDVAILTDNFNITNGLTVIGTTNLTNTGIVGTIIQTGNTLRTGNVNLTGNLNSTTLTTADRLQLNEIRLESNFIKTTSSNSNLELRANGSGVVRFFDNTTINNDLTIVGNTTVTNLTIFSDISSPVLTTTNINILGNLITTTVANSDLELAANGTGVISIPYDGLSLGVDLTVNGTSNFKTSTVVGAIDIIGNYNQLSSTATFNTNVVISGGNLTSTSDSQFERIRISGNRIRTTALNNNLILTANGTGSVDILDSANFANNLNVLGTSNVSGSIVVSNILTAGGYDFGNIEISGNVIRTTESNSNLELRGNASGGIRLEEITLVNSTFTSTSSIGLTPTGTGSIRFNATNALVIPKGNTSNRTLSEAGEIRFNTAQNSFEGYGNAGLIILDRFQDGDRNTSITAELTVGAGDNVIRFFTNGTQRASISSTGITAHGLRTSTLDFNANTISSYNSNADVELRPNGTGKVKFPTFTIKNGLITNTTTNANTVLENTGQGYTVLGDSGLVMPVGDNTNRPAVPEVGHTRFNTQLGYLEVWTGTGWVVATGGGSYISEAEVNDITDFYALIFG